MAALVLATSALSFSILSALSARTFAGTFSSYPSIAIFFSSSAACFSVAATRFVSLAISAAGST